MHTQRASARVIHAHGAFNGCDKRPWRSMCWKRTNIPLLEASWVPRKSYCPLHDSRWPQSRIRACKRALRQPKTAIFNKIRSSRCKMMHVELALEFFCTKQRDRYACNLFSVKKRVKIERYHVLYDDFIRLWYKCWKFWNVLKKVYNIILKRIQYIIFYIYPMY